MKMSKHIDSVNDTNQIKFVIISDIGRKNWTLTTMYMWDINYWKWCDHLQLIYSTIVYYRYKIDVIQILKTVVTDLFIKVYNAFKHDSAALHAPALIHALKNLNISNKFHFNCRVILIVAIYLDTLSKEISIHYNERNNSYHIVYKTLNLYGTNKILWRKNHNKIVLTNSGIKFNKESTHSCSGVRV